MSHSSSRTFVCAGLGRCRTAWFSNLFTWGNTLCAHDMLCAEQSACGVNSFARLRDFLMPPAGEWRGHSDATNIFWWKAIDKHFPTAKWVWIERDPSEVLASFQKIDPRISADFINSVYDESRKMIDYLQPMFVEFDEIDPRKCYEIADYIGVDIGPAMRVNQLCDFNIQIHPEVLQRRIAALWPKESPITEREIEHMRALEPEAQRMLAKYA